ncbi:MAG: alpha-L-arabinofuranosidase [Deltaproteobacteria bacterium]|jgi:hypothetical protein|nr:alpha-L-arabinofuranosidase [Deltaproteobacteria bacterium]
MRTRSLSNELLLVAVFGIFSWGCTMTSDQDAGTSSGGATGSGGVSDTGGQQDSGGAMGSGGATGAGGKTFDPAKLPCDIYEEDGGPCVAAHSTIRRLRSAYDGDLYQVRIGGSKSGTGGATAEIGFDADGFADAAAQDAACGDDACTISIIYDQSGKGNHLTVAPAGGAKKTPDNEANAKALPVTIGGHSLYGVKITPGIGYRDNTPNGTATGDGPQTAYMIVNGDFYNSGCCFDYGNAETNSMDNGEGTMEAVYFGDCTFWNKGDGDGPWVMGDLENGLWAGDYSPYEKNKPVTHKWITAMVKGDSKSTTWPDGHWAIKVGNAQSGALDTPFEGKRPSDRYNPMRKEGAIILGTGGDNSNSAQGNWYEGLMTTHFSSNAADDAVQANIVSAYGQ